MPAQQYEDVATAAAGLSCVPTVVVVVVVVVVLLLLLLVLVLVLVFFFGGGTLELLPMQPFLPLDLGIDSVFAHLPTQ